MTRATLARTMTENEFQDWQRYAARRMLPARRMEFYMAQMSLLIDKTMGGVKNAKLADYMFDPVDESEPTAEDEVAFFDFKPRKKIEG